MDKLELLIYLALAASILKSVSVIALAIALIQREKS
jgi:hypothetical protein